MAQPRQQQIFPDVKLTFYSNASNINVNGLDAFIDFVQFPQTNNEVPTIRVLMSHNAMIQLAANLMAQEFVATALAPKPEDEASEDEAEAEKED